MIKQQIIKEHLTSITNIEVRNQMNQAIEQILRVVKENMLLNCYRSKDINNMKEIVKSAYESLGDFKIELSKIEILREKINNGEIK